LARLAGTFAASILIAVVGWRINVTWKRIHH
jgi:hypothetical protein